MTIGYARRLETNWVTRGMVVTVAMATMLTWAVPAAHAAPPDVEARIEFVIGSQVDHNYKPEVPWDAAYADAVLRVELGAFDDVTPPGTWSVETWFAGMAPNELASGSIGALGAEIGLTVPIEATDYEDDFGGGTFAVTHYEVEAVNGAGATTTVNVTAPIVVVQEDGKNARFDALEPGTSVTTNGRWRMSNWNGWLDGQTAWTTKKGSRMWFTATVSEGQVIAIVMPLAKNRGEARIKLDGVNQGRVDTYVPGKIQRRTVVWQTPPLSAGSHTIEVINVATPGHPRIDIDAFMIAG